MFTFIDNVAERTEEQRGKDNAPFEAPGEETGDARDSLSLMRNGFTTESTEAGTLRVERVGGTSLG
jgi:hypothetical protein